jgi:hypothetical protein
MEDVHNKTPEQPRCSPLVFVETVKYPIGDRATGRTAGSNTVVVELPEEQAPAVVDKYTLPQRSHGTPFSTE